VLPSPLAWALRHAETAAGANASSGFEFYKERLQGRREEKV